MTDWLERTTSFSVCPPMNVTWRYSYGTLCRVYRWSDNPLFAAKQSFDLLRDLPNMVFKSWGFWMASGIGLLVLWVAFWLFEWERSAFGLILLFAPFVGALIVLPFIWLLELLTVIFGAAFALITWMITVLGLVGPVLVLLHGWLTVKKDIQETATRYSTRK